MSDSLTGFSGCGGDGGDGGGGASSGPGGGAQTTGCSGNVQYERKHDALTDAVGPLACSGNGAFVTGTCPFTVSGSSLSFSNPSDLCAGRVSILTGGIWAGH